MLYSFGFFQFGCFPSVWANFRVPMCTHFARLLLFISPSVAGSHLSLSHTHTQSGRYKMMVIHRFARLRHSWLGAHAWQLEKRNHASMKYKLSRVLIMSSVCFSIFSSISRTKKKRAKYSSNSGYCSHLSNGRASLLSSPHSIFNNMWSNTMHGKTQITHARTYRRGYNCRFDLIGTTISCWFQFVCPFLPFIFHTDWTNSILYPTNCREKNWYLLFK